ncbi:MAG: porin [Sphingomonas sp.]
MVAGRVMVGMIAGVLVAAGAIVAPAFGAVDQPVRLAKRDAPTIRSVGAFTPAAADPRLAAMFARGGFDPRSFRFTPAETRRDNRAVTVAVRARTNRSADTSRLATAAPSPSVGLAPIAYNLGMSVGWKRFAVSGDVSRLDMAGMPGSRDSADLAVSYSARRFTGSVKAATDRPLANAPRMVESPETYSVDLGGSYALTRNLDVTAGVRYRSDRERLARIDDNRRDSQAVYLGTAFRF